MIVILFEIFHRYDMAYVEVRQIKINNAVKVIYIESLLRKAG